MKFEIENFFEFKEGGKVRAGLSVKTEGGFYYDCKLVEGGSNGFFIASNQSREYKKKDGERAYVVAFGTLRGTPAAAFFDAVAVEAAKKLRQNAQAGNTDYPDDSIPF